MLIQLTVTLFFLTIPILLHYNNLDDDNMEYTNIWSDVERDDDSIFYDRYSP